jgi:hypothetical protein
VCLDTSAQSARVPAHSAECYVGDNRVCPVPGASLEGLPAAELAELADVLPAWG